MKKYAIIADDLTGGMDSGIQAGKQGLSATLVIDREKIGKLMSSMDIVVINTSSRGYSKGEAYQSVKEAIKTLSDQKVELLYKKIDSTIRGNLGAELDAILDNMCIDMIFVNPALPSAGRKVIDGELFLDGKKITETGFKDDMISPVKYSFIPDLIKEQTVRDVGLITKIQGEDLSNLVKKIRDHHKKGIEILVSDAYTDNHLLNSIVAVKKSGLNVILCGSAGLLEAYFSVFNKQVYDEKKVKIKKGNALVITSSLNKITNQQIMLAKERLKTEVVKLSIDNMYNKSETKRLVKKIEQMVNGNKDVILTTDERRSSDPPKVVNSLAEVLYKLKVGNLAGVMIIGGDTALGCCKRIKAQGIEILSELEPYVPIGKVVGGKYKGLPIITKAGGLGEKDAVIKAIKYFGGG